MNSSKQQPIHYSNNVISILAPYLRKAQSIVRINTAFFGITGYGIIDKYIASHVTIKLLVGYDREQFPQTKRQLLNMIKQGLWSELFNSHGSFLQIAKNLLTKLENGKGNIKIQHIDSDIPAKHNLSTKKNHAKIYIIDNHVILHGSANLSVSGLKQNVENFDAKFDHIDETIKQFDDYYEHTPGLIDLTPYLIEWLDEITKMYTVHDLFLKHIDTFSDRAPTKREPTDYQVHASTNLLNSLQRHRGGLLLGTAGIGKTLIICQTLGRIDRINPIDKILVFCPKYTIPSWKLELKSVGFSSDIFSLYSYQNLNSRIKLNIEGIINAMYRDIERLTEYSYVIIDEAHNFRSTISRHNGQVRTSAKNALKIHDRSANVILATATVDSSNDEGDINNILRMLPPTNLQTQNSIFESRWIVDCPAWLKPMNGSRRQLEQETQKELGTHLLNEIASLEITTRLTNKIIQDRYAQDVEFNGEVYKQISFPDKTTAYYPLVTESRIEYMPQHHKLAESLSQQIFREDVVRDEDRSYDYTKKEDVLTEKRKSYASMQFDIAFMSSAKCLYEFLKQLDDEVHDFKLDVSTVRSNILKLIKLYEPIVEKPLKYDDKVIKLVQVCRTRIAQNKKILIFTCRHVTALYLQEVLTQSGFFDAEAIESITELSETDEDEEARFFAKPKTKKPHEISRIIAKFSPESNQERRDQISNELWAKFPEINILIATDKLAAGVNLQQAEVIIHFDHPIERHQTIQRTGRSATRFFKTPRKVEVVYMVDKCDTFGKQSQFDGNLDRISVYTNSSTVIDNPGHIIQMDEIGDDKKSSELFQYFSRLTTINKDYVSKLPKDLTAAARSDSFHGMITCVEINNQPTWIYAVNQNGRWEIKNKTLLEITKLIDRNIHQDIPMAKITAINEQEQVLDRYMSLNSKVTLGDTMYTLYIVPLKVAKAKINQ